MADKQDMSGTEWVHRVSLPNDHGNDIRVEGRLVAEDMHFNNVSGMLTVEKIYEMGEGRRAYGVISAIGHTRHRSAYLLEERGENLLISNGSLAMEVPVDDLLALLAGTLAEDAERELGYTECEHIRRRLAAND